MPFVERPRLFVGQPLFHRFVDELFTPTKSLVGPHPYASNKRSEHQASAHNAANRHCAHKSRNGGRANNRRTTKGTRAEILVFRQPSTRPFQLGVGGQWRVPEVLQ